LHAPVENTQVLLATPPNGHGQVGDSLYRRLRGLTDEELAEIRASLQELKG